MYVMYTGLDPDRWRMCASTATAVTGVRVQPTVLESRFDSRAVHLQVPVLGVVSCYAFRKLRHSFR
jgi:hypothetical protein